LGAKIARVLFGQKGYDLIVGHNVYDGNEKSLLHDPDKYANVIAPIWWLVTNTIIEPKLLRPNCTRKESAIMFKAAMKKNMENGFQQRGHDIYLEQMEEIKMAGKNKAQRKKRAKTKKREHELLAQKPKKIVADQEGDVLGNNAEKVVTPEEAEAKMEAHPAFDPASVVAKVLEKNGK